MGEEMERSDPAHQLQGRDGRIEQPEKDWPGAEPLPQHEADVV